MPEISFDLTDAEMGLLAWFAQQNDMDPKEAAQTLLSESVPSLFFKALPDAGGKVIPFKREAA